MFWDKCDGRCTKRLACERKSCNCISNLLYFLFTCQASVPDFLLQDALCTCKAGKGSRCKHIAAVVHYINSEENRSCTSGPRLWGKPSVRALGTYKKGAILASKIPASENKDTVKEESVCNNFGKRLRDLTSLQTRRGKDTKLKNKSYS